MGLFDKLKTNPAPTPQTVQVGGNKSVKITFGALPDSYETFIALPEAKMDNPFSTAALSVLAFCFYPENKDLSLQMLDFLRGPRPLSVMDKQFIADRFRDKDYVPRSYFVGATPQNNYLPSEPYLIVERQGLTGTMVPKGIELTKEELPGFKALSYEVLEIAADDSTVIEIRYERNYYLVDFDMEGGYGVEPVYTRYGSAVGANVPTRHGYGFNKWVLEYYGDKAPTSAQMSAYDILN